MFRRMVTRSAISRPAQLVWTLLTLVSASALIAFFVTIHKEVSARLAGTFGHLGANAVVREDASGHGDDGDSAGRERAWDGLRMMAVKDGVALAELHVKTGWVQGLPVAVAACSPSDLKALTPYWQITGGRNQGLNECLVGRHLASRLGTKKGDPLVVSLGSSAGARTYRVAGLFESGDADEDRIFVSSFAGKATPSSHPEPTAKNSEGGFTYAILAVPDGSAGIARLADFMKAQRLPLEIRPLRAMVAGEEAILSKVQLLCTVTAVAVLLLAALGLSAAVAARIFERSREISLLRSLGAKKSWVGAMLAAESAGHGMAGGLLGFLAGTLLAAELGRGIFGVGFSPDGSAFLASTAVSVLMALLAGAVAVRRALAVEPSALLRSE